MIDLARVAAESVFFHGSGNSDGICIKTGRVVNHK